MKNALGDSVFIRIGISKGSVTAVYEYMIGFINPKGWGVKTNPEALGEGCDFHIDPEYETESSKRNMT